MDPNQRPKRPPPDPHFERLHGPPLSYAQSIQSFLQTYNHQPAFTTMDSSAEASGLSQPTVPDVVHFDKGKVPTGDMPPPPTPGLLSGFQTPCGDTCSLINCDSGCNPSVVDSGTCSFSQCNNLDQCSSEECCREPACLEHDSVPATRRESIDFSAEDHFASSSQNQFASSCSVFPAYDLLPGFDNIDDDSVQCHWLLPDQECDITAPTKDALSQHVYHDHIQPETSLACGWSDCEEQINAQQFTEHLWNSHHPEQHASDSYVCLWDGCMETFPDADQLETHMEAAHTHMDSIDCRWGGCGTVTTNSAELQSHVNKEHLHLHMQPVLPSPDLAIGLSDHSDTLPSKKSFYWSAEEDDLLMRVRAQNLTFPQIASQFFPERSDQGCQRRYALLWNKQQQFASQSTEQSTPLLAYSPLLSSPYATSPYEPHHPLVDTSFLQTSPALLSDQSNQLVSETQGDHKCMWIIDDAAETVCGDHFGHPNELQAHVESSHHPLSDNSRRRPAPLWACKWMGCARKGQSRRSRDKLKKHVCTHTGCK